MSCFPNWIVKNTFFSRPPGFICPDNFICRGLTGEFIGRDGSNTSEGGTPKNSSKRECLESIVKSTSNPAWEKRVFQENMMMVIVLLVSYGFALPWIFLLYHPSNKRPTKQSANIWQNASKERVICKFPTFVWGVAVTCEIIGVTSASVSVVVCPGKHVSGSPMTITCPFGSKDSSIYIYMDHPKDHSFFVLELRGSCFVKGFCGSLYHICQVHIMLLFKHLPAAWINTSNMRSLLCQFHGCSLVAMISCAVMFLDNTCS